MSLHTMRTRSVHASRKLESCTTIEIAQGPEAGLPAPDLVLYLRMPNPEAAAQRGGFGNERYMTEVTICIAQDMLHTNCLPSRLPPSHKPVRMLLANGTYVASPFDMRQ